MTETTKTQTGHPTPHQPGKDAPLTTPNPPRQDRPAPVETLTDRQDDYSNKTAAAQEEAKSN